MASRNGSVVETKLQKNKILPLIELGTHFWHAGHLNEAESLVEPNRRFVPAINGRNHRVLASFPRPFDESPHEEFADSRTPSILPHMNGVLDREAIARPLLHITEPSERGDSDDLTLVFRHQYNLVFTEPLLHLVSCPRRISPFDGSRSQKRIEDRSNLRGIYCSGSPN